MSFTSRGQIVNEVEGFIECEGVIERDAALNCRAVTTFPNVGTTTPGPFFDLQLTAPTTDDCFILTRRGGMVHVNGVLFYATNATTNAVSSAQWTAIATFSCAVDSLASRRQFCGKRAPGESAIIGYGIALLADGVPTTASGSNPVSLVAPVGATGSSLYSRYNVPMMCRAKLSGANDVTTTIEVYFPVMTMVGSATIPKIFISGLSYPARDPRSMDVDL